jgi:hypothetical protein
MRNFLKLPLSVALAAVLALACGGGNKTTTNPNLLTFKGTGATGLTVLPQAALVLTAAAGGTAYDIGPITNFQVDLLDPIKLLLGGEAAARLGNSPVTPTQTATNSGDFTVTNVDRTTINPLTPGLVVNILDNNTPKKQTTPTSTGVIATTSAGVLPPGDTLTATAPAFIIPDAFADILAGLSLGAGKTHVDLGTGGSIVVLVVDRSTTPPTPVAGAKLAPVPGHAIAYPTFPGGVPTPGTATDSTGLVVITGPATGTSPISIVADGTSVVPPCATTTSTGCLAAAAAGLSPGLNFVAVMLKH